MLQHAKIWHSLSWLFVVIVIILSLDKPSANITPLFPHMDKVGHALAYATLSLCFNQLYSGRVKHLIICLLLAALGIALEFAQSLTGYRMFEINDMIANTSGVIVGLLLAIHTHFGHLFLTIEKLLGKK